MTLVDLIERCLKKRKPTFDSSLELKHLIDDEDDDKLIGLVMMITMTVESLCIFEEASYIPASAP